MSSYSILALSALLMVYSHPWKTFGQKIDTTLGYVGLIVTAVFPILVLYLMIKHFKDFDTKMIKSKYGSLYEDLRITNKWIISYRFWFLVRRLVMVINVVFVKDLMMQIVIWFIQ